MTKKSTNLKTIENFKLQALFKKNPYNCKIKKWKLFYCPEKLCSNIQANLTGGSLATE